MSTSSSSNHATRNGMTLVELLITITIIAILSAILLGAAATAGETARRSRTKQLVTRLHTLLLERYDTYRNRRVDAEFDGSGQVLAAQRLHVLRTTMQMEMPDRWSDILNQEPSNLLPSAVANGSFAPDDDVPFGLIGTTDNYVIPRTALNRLYLRKYAELANDVTALLQNQSAECLYLTIMYGTAEGEARGLFKENDIGDTDGDGALEFLDGWGKPIRFIRWPHGYTEFSAILDNTNPISNHDPLDTFRVDTMAYRGLNAGTDDTVCERLIPLIYSSGSDEEYGLATNNSGSNFRFGTVALNFSPGGTQQVLDPYQLIDVDLRVGQPRDSNANGVPIAITAEHHVDNITNHQITAR